MPKAKLAPVQKSAQDLAKEMAAAHALRETLKALGAEEPDLIRDSIEGQTNLHEAIEQVDTFILDDECLVAGIKRAQEALAARKDRIEKRIDFYRGAIEQALLIGEVDKLELSTGTISLRETPPKLEIIAESDIPTRFWTQPEPVLDRKALMDALKENAADCIAAANEGRDPPEPIPGAKLTDKGISISIRRA